MKSNLKYLFVLLIAGMAFAMPAKASHVAGVDITYQCLGNDSFLVTVNVFRDCSGATWTAQSINVNFSSTCGQNFNAQLNTTNALNGSQAIGINVSQLCPTALSNCNGGTHPGMLLFTYQAIVVLNPPCNTWTIGYAPPCCRNNNLNLSPNQGNTFVSSTLNSVTDSCNNSPTIATTNPNPYACVGQLICYDLGVTEIDGDSLVYSFDTAYQNATTPFGYNAGYSAQVPIPGITIDPATGNIQFIPMVAGNYVIVIKICEYDRNTGALKGCITRDLQWVVNNCNNAAPAQLCNPNSIISFSGSGAQISANEVEVCYGQNFSFVILVSDSFGLSSTQYLTATSNVQSVLPGSQFSVVSNTAQDSLWITVSWVATLGAAPFNTFNVNVSDNNCPVTATNSGTYIVRVIPSTYGGPDHQICKGIETANLNAIGGTQFTWSVISGDPNSLSCTNCANTVVNPNTTTEYQVMSNLSSSCKNIDTVLVKVSQNYQLNMSNDTLICFNDSTIQIGAFPSINRVFNYQWSPPSKLNFDTVQTPLATPVSNTTYNVTVTSDSGCIKTGNVTVSTTLPFPTTISASTTSGDSVSCQGVPFILDAQLGVEPSGCGISANPCSGLTINNTVGTGTLTNLVSGNAASNAWPSPYSNSERSARHQFIISRSELAANGISPGTISSLAFNISTLTGTANYENFEIKLGCIPDSTFTFNPQTGSFWKQGLTTVFNPKNINLTTGWNAHQFDNFYDYDGQSHLIVEVCFNNTGAVTQNAQVFYSNTSFNSSLFFYSSTVTACGNNNLLSPPVARRPNMRFGFCGGPNPSGYKYQWWPSTGLDNDTLKNPTATLTDSITYYLAVKDTSDKCFDTSKIKLFLTTLEKSADTAICPNVPFQLFATGNTSCTGGASYQWAPANLVNNPNIANPIASITQTTWFTVTFQDQCGCTITDSILVTKKEIDSLGIIKTVPTCGLLNGAYLLKPSGGEFPYQFSIDSGNTFLNDSIFSGLNNGYYDVLIKDNAGCYSYKLDTLQNTAPIIDSIKTKNLTCFESQDGVVEVFTSGGNYPLSYSVNGGTSYVTSDSVINLPFGMKDIIVKAADGCETSPVKRLLTQPNFLEFDLAENVVSCNGYADGRLTITPSGGTKPYTYTWNTINGVDSIADSLLAGSYSVSITDINNCLADTTYLVAEPTKVALDSMSIIPITCNGYKNGIVHLFPSGANGGFVTSIDSGKTYLPITTYDSIGPVQYYLVIKDYKGCLYDTSFTVSEPDPLIINPNFDTTTICVSNCLDISAPYTGGNQGKVTYFWTPSFTDSSTFNFCPTENSRFIVYAKDVRNCVSNLEEIQVNLFDSLRVTTSGDTNICKTFGLPIVAFPSGGDGNGFNYEWTPYPGLNNPKIKQPFANPAQTTTYKIVITDNCGSPAVEDTLRVVVYPNPQVAFSSDETEGCQQQLIYFTNDSDIGSDCLWNFGDGTSVNACNIIAHPYNEPGFYDVKLRVISSGGCSDSLTKERFIKVYPNPIADFLMNPQPATLLDPEVEFTDISIGAIREWNWNFGSFTTSEESNPKIVFPVDDSGSYPVRLKVTTKDGCVDDTVKFALVDVNLMIYAPRGFTPNGDGLNDLFFPQGTGLDQQEFEFLIFDRWGKVVFQTNTIGDGWNGKLPSGEPAPVGIYVWKLNVGDYTSNRRRHEVIGNVSLMK